MESSQFKKRARSPNVSQSSSSQKLSSKNVKHRDKHRSDRERHKSGKHKERHHSKHKGRYHEKEADGKDDATRLPAIVDKKELNRNLYNDRMRENYLKDNEEKQVQSEMLPARTKFSNKDYVKNNEGAPNLGETSSSIIKEVLDSKGVFAMKMERLAEIVRWKKLLNAERDRTAKPQQLTNVQVKPPPIAKDKPPTKRKRRSRFDDGTIYLPSDSPHSSDDETMKNLQTSIQQKLQNFTESYEIQASLEEYHVEMDTNETENLKEVEEDDEEVLPPYYPAIQGCRSVEEFRCLNHIEEGTYGIVFRAVDKGSNEIVALKRLKMEREKEGFPITSLREINTLLKAQHLNIVTVREIVVGNHMDSIFIVMDYVEHDLKSLMELMKHKEQSFTIGEVKCLMKQLLCAVAFLHDNWILHRDLKPSNLLVSHKGILKVGDFGLAREYGSPLKAYTPIVVTLWYRAPELLLCTKQYSTAIDLWSVGCIFAEMLFMRPIFQGKSEIEQINRIFKMLGTPNEHIWPGYKALPMVKNAKLPDFAASNIKSRFRMLTPQGQALLLKLLTYDPAQRITGEDAVKHFYFNESPFPIDPSDFPKWPAKSELGKQRALASSPKPPSGGGEYKRLACEEIEEGFRIGISESLNKGLMMDHGFSLKF